MNPGITIETKLVSGNGLDDPAGLTLFYKMMGVSPAN